MPDVAIVVGVLLVVGLCSAFLRSVFKPPPRVDPHDWQQVDEERQRAHWNSVVGKR